MTELYENRNYVGLLRILYCAFLTKTYACPKIEKLHLGAKVFSPLGFLVLKPLGVKTLSHLSVPR